MTLPLPDLSRRRFDDLVEEMRALIPQISPEWTNHNVSDPGITLMELLAWITEVNLYRANRIPHQTTVNFIALLLGETVQAPSDKFRDAMQGVTTQDIVAAAKSASVEVEYLFVRYSELDNRVSAFIVLRSGTPNINEVIFAVQMRLSELWLGGPVIVVETLEHAKQRALRFFNAPYRAITPDDFAREVKLASTDVGRVRVQSDAQSGTITVVIVHAADGNSQTGQLVEHADSVEFPVYAPQDLSAYTVLLEKVNNRLAERKLVGTRVVVKPPTYTELKLTIDIVVNANTVIKEVLIKCGTAIFNFFNPITGGEQSGGWRFGRSVSVFELYRIAESIAGVDHVERIVINDDEQNHDVPIMDLPGLNELTLRAVS